MWYFSCKLSACEPNEIGTRNHGHIAETENKYRMASVEAFCIYMLCQFTLATLRGLAATYTVERELREQMAIEHYRAYQLCKQIEKESIEIAKGLFRSCHSLLWTLP